MSDVLQLPWSLQSRKKNRICGPEGLIIAESWYPPAKTTRDAKHEAKQIGDARAAFIVRAVNSHEALIKALEQIERVAGNIPDDVLCQATGPNDARYRGGLVCTARDIARTALSQAKGDAS